MNIAALHFSPPPAACPNAGAGSVHHSSRHPQLPKSGVFSATTIQNRVKRRCQYIDLHENLIPYKEAWSLQKSIVSHRKMLMERDEDNSDTLIILQHPSVYTLGTNSVEKYLKFDIQNSPFDIYRTERGGQVTYHGPGQLVAYPILNLHYHERDLHWYLRSLEEIIIRVLSKTFSIQASRREGLTGVWIGYRKIAAIGIRVSRWITYHGIALNVTTDLAPFQCIIPCGITDGEVCSIKELLKMRSECKIEDDVLLSLAHDSLIDQFSNVLQLSMESTAAYSNLVKMAIRSYRY